MKTIEYRVRPVTRFIVTKFVEEVDGQSSQPVGEFDNDVLASNAALAFADHETRMAQPPEKIIRHDGVTWDRATNRWSDDPTIAPN